jgi:hypothetical protein
MEELLPIETPWENGQRFRVIRGVNLGREGLVQSNNRGTTTTPCYVYVSWSTTGAHLPQRVLRDSVIRYEFVVQATIVHTVAIERRDRQLGRNRNRNEICPIEEIRRELSALKMGLRRVELILTHARQNGER